MKKNNHTLSTKIKYLSLGIFVYLSIISIFATPSIGSDGKFGDYFVRITGICLPWEIITGYENGISDYGTKKCVSLKTLFWNIFGSSTPPIDSSFISFDFPSGNLIYKNNVWKTNANGISYTGSQVGIGTSIPGSKLDILSGDINVNPLGGGNIIIWASNAWTVRISDMNASYFNGGFVGIGTSTPTAQLEVVGNTKVSTELRTQYIMLAGQPLKIPVVCTGQGKWLHWDGSNWSCIAMPIEWACNNAVANTCTYGTPSGYNAGSCGGNATWTCNGINGWSNASCSKANPSCAVNGVCGPANATKTTNYPASGWCSTGAKSDGDTIGSDGTFNWTCLGTGGGSDANCSSSPFAIHCSMRLDNDCWYSGPTLTLYTTCGNFTVWRSDWGYANVFPIPWNVSCNSTGISGVDVWSWGSLIWYDPYTGDPIYSAPGYSTPGSTNFWTIPSGWQWGIWNYSCDNWNWLNCWIY